MTRAGFLILISLQVASVTDPLEYLLHSRAQGQTIISEVLVPTPLEGVGDVDVYAGANNNLHIVGRASATDTLPNGWDGFQLLFVCSRQTSDSITTTLLPDTAWYWSDGFHGEEYEFNRATTLDTDGNVILFWTKQYSVLSDIPPYIRSALPTGKCVKKTAEGVLDIFDLQGSASPALCVGPDNTAHFVWESIRSVRSDSNYAVYSSQLFYRSLTSGGQLSGPMPVDTGFAPRVSSQLPGIVHVVWLTGDSSTASTFSLRYRVISNDIPTPIVTLKNRVNPTGDLSMVVDSAGIIHVGWTETRLTYYQFKVFLLSFDGIMTTIDSSQVYSGSTGKLRLEVSSNGSVDAIWSAGMYTDSLYYYTTTNPPLNDARIFSHPDFRFYYAQALFARSIGPSGSMMGGLQTMWYLGDLESKWDSTITVLPGKMFPNSVHPVAVDGEGNVWVAYGKYPGPPYYQLGLARITEQASNVTAPYLPPIGSLRLHQNYPNPFNPGTEIGYRIEEAGHVTLIVYDLLGREVKTLVNERRNAGSYTVTWDAAGQPSGVYFYRLSTNDFVQTRKLILLR